MTSFPEKFISVNSKITDRKTSLEIAKYFSYNFPLVIRDISLQIADFFHELLKKNCVFLLLLTKNYELKF